VILAQLPETFESHGVQWSSLLPLLILVGGGMTLLVVGAVAGRLPRGFYAAATVVIGLAAFVFAWVDWHRVNTDGAMPLVGSALSLDGFSVFFMVVIISSLVLAALLADDYLRRERLDGVEPYVVMILSAVGAIVLASANDLVVVFLGLETLSIALYVLAAVHRRRLESQEASLKYFLLGSFSSAFFLYGVALVYGATGSTNMGSVGRFLADNVLLENGLLLAGLALMFVGLAFKVSAVPFHTWTPDVYQGAPTPITAFMASASKAAAFAALLRIFYLTFQTYSVDWRPIVWVVAVLTLIIGSITAVVQTDVKRMMAYSSISHAGFILVGVEAATDRGTAAALFYVLAYSFMVIGSFGVITLVGRTGDSRHDVDDYRGLGRSRPVLALTFTVLLLAQAGVPLTSGFLAKFEVIGAAVDAESYAIAIIAMVASVISAFVYLRIVVSMYLVDASAETDGEGVRIPAGAGLALLVTVAFTLFAGILPNLVVDFARDAVPVLVAGP